MWIFNIFSLLSIYFNTDYFFRRKNSIVELELDIDFYFSIIWYIWKVWNNKFFREIYKDFLELVRYVESEF